MSFFTVLPIASQFDNKDTLSVVERKLFEFWLLEFSLSLFTQMKNVYFLQYFAFISGSLAFFPLQILPKLFVPFVHFPLRLSIFFVHPCGTRIVFIVCCSSLMSLQSQFYLLQFKADFGCCTTIAMHSIVALLSEKFRLLRSFAYSLSPPLHHSRMLWHFSRFFPFHCILYHFFSLFAIFIGE